MTGTESDRARASSVAIAATAPSSSQARGEAGSVNPKFMSITTIAGRSPAPARLPKSIRPRIAYRIVKAQPWAGRDPDSGRNRAMANVARALPDASTPRPRAYRGPGRTAAPGVLRPRAYCGPGRTGGPGRTATARAPRPAPPDAGASLSLAGPSPGRTVCARARQEVTLQSEPRGDIVCNMQGPGPDGLARVRLLGRRARGGRVRAERGRDLDGLSTRR